MTTIEFTTMYDAKRECPWCGNHKCYVREEKTEHTIDVAVICVLCQARGPSVIRTDLNEEDRIDTAMEYWEDGRPDFRG